MAKEILDIVDDNGQPTGEVIDRVTAHREGILHRTSHVWLVRMKDRMPNWGVAALESHTLPNRNFTSPISRIAGMPEMMR